MVIPISAWLLSLKDTRPLEYPGRDASFDANSQVPTGSHNGRTIYYVFGRYPKRTDPDGDSYPVIDLVICHGDFLNADHEYIHQNKSVKGFGSYGDILIRDRKMYVAPTPFHLAEGVAHHQTLIVPTEMDAGQEFHRVGTLTRRETEELVIAYSFDLRSNEIVADTVRNPFAGREHTFGAWRLKGSPKDSIRMRATRAVEDKSR